jgi:SPP1 gp7 family putative phage head morphogenesis protein
VYSELEGITAAMDQKISRILAHGVAEGWGPREIARDISEEIAAISRNRAEVLARTEVISAHAEASLNAYEEAGIEGVEVEAEWSTAGDDRVCPECEEMEGKTFDLDEAKGMIPLHPQCRCAWIPKVVNGTGIVLT